MFKESYKAYQFIKNFKAYKGASDDIAKQRALLYLNETLGSDGGMFTKVLQYLGTSNQDLNLIKNAKSTSQIGLEKDFVENILKETFPQNYQNVTNISQSALTASVGQINSAEIDGKKVAIKTQYPGIKNIFIQQLRLFNFLPKVTQFTQLKKWGIDFNSFQQKFQDLIEIECDYTNEIQKLEEWRQKLLDYPHASVPNVHYEFCSSQVYIQDFIEGETIEEVIQNWSDLEKEQLGYKILDSYLYLLLQYNEIQGDTNHGNFLFSKKNLSPHIHYIDLGQTYTLSSKFVETLATAIDMKIKGEVLPPMEFLTKLGFDSIKLKHIYPKLDILVEILLEPFLNDFSMRYEDWNYKEKLDLLLGEEKWWFRSSGGVEFFIFMKSFLGIKNLIQKLNVEINSKYIFLDRYNVAKTPRIFFRADEIDEKYMKEYKAKNLQVLVLENKIEKVNLHLPFHSLFDLETLIDPDILQKIKSQGHNLYSITQDALNDGGKPKNIFEHEEGEKIYRLNLV